MILRPRFETDEPVKQFLEVLARLTDYAVGFEPDGETGQVEGDDYDSVQVVRIGRGGGLGGADSQAGGHFVDGFFQHRQEII